MGYTLGQVETVAPATPQVDPARQALARQEMARLAEQGAEIARRKKTEQACWFYGSIGGAGAIAGGVAYAVSKRKRPSLGVLAGLGAAAASGLAAHYVLKQQRVAAWNYQTAGLGGVITLGFGGIAMLVGSLIGAAAGRTKGLTPAPG